MAVTTKDIARICGVSRTTVDRALNAKGRISPATKEKVLQTAKELGYHPDLLARSLVTGTTMSIGAVMTDINNRHFAQMVNAIAKKATEKGYLLNITVSEQDCDLERHLIDSLVSRRVDGLIISPINKGAEFESYLKNLSVPVVLIGNENSAHIPFIGINERLAAYDATIHILLKGYEHIVFVAPPLEDKETKNIVGHEKRLEGFWDAVKKRDSVTYDIIGKWDFICEAEAVLRAAIKKTAFLFSADVYALDAIKHFKDSGFIPPRDYGAMGFDRIDMLEYITPLLTSVSNAVEETGEKSVETLVGLIQGLDVEESIVLPHKIVEGESL